MCTPSGSVCCIVVVVIQWWLIDFQLKFYEFYQKCNKTILIHYTDFEHLPVNFEDHVWWLYWHITIGIEKLLTEISQTTYIVGLIDKSYEKNQNLWKLTATNDIRFDCDATVSMIENKNDFKFNSSYFCLRYLWWMMWFGGFFQTHYLYQFHAYLPRERKRAREREREKKKEF